MVQLGQVRVLKTTQECFKLLYFSLQVLASVRLQMQFFPICAQSSKEQSFGGFNLVFFI